MAEVAPAPASLAQTAEFSKSAADSTDVEVVSSEQTVQSKEEPTPTATEVASDGADNVLADTVTQQAEQIKDLADRVKDLELTLADTRKMVNSREDLLAHLQWKPKEDYYVWKNSTINDKTVRDAQERKLKTLLEQMRVMEKCLAERDQVINQLIGHPGLADSVGISPFNSPLGGLREKGSPAISPGWSRSPAESPAVSPAVNKSSWWSFKRSIGQSGNIKSSTNSFQSSSGLSSPESAYNPSLASSLNSSSTSPPATRASPPNTRVSPVPARAQQQRVSPVPVRASGTPVV